MTSQRRWLLRAGSVAGPLFLATSTIDGLFRTDYSLNRHPISSLALGPAGWVQTANFAVTGGLYLAGAEGLRRSHEADSVVGLVAVTAASAGIFLASLFTTDPVNGYPPGTADVPAERTVSGVLHDAVSVPTFFGLPLAALTYSVAFGRSGQWTWSIYSAVNGLGMLAALAPATSGFNGSARFANHAGRWQRICDHRTDLVERAHGAPSTSPIELDVWPSSSESCIADRSRIADRAPVGHRDGLVPVGPSRHRDTVSRSGPRKRRDRVRRRVRVPSRPRVVGNVPSPLTERAGPRPVRRPHPTAAAPIR